VAELAELRRELVAAGGDYKIYKNTLVRLAVADGPQAPIHELLTGPTAIAFVQGDVSAVAKALRDFARNNPNLVVKGGMVGTGVLSAADIEVLADLPSRDTLLSQFAGALAAPLQQLAGLVQALPRNLAYGLSALIDQRQAGGEVLEVPADSSEEAAAEPATEAAAEPAAAEAAAEPATEAAAEPATEAAAEPATEAAAEPATEAAAEPAPEAAAEPAPEKVDEAPAEASDAG
jgi:large subunit ribosomal protein L10